MVLLQMCPRLVYFVYALTSVSAMFIILHYSQKSPWISLSFLEILVGSESKEHICSLSVFLNLFFHRFLGHCVCKAKIHSSVPFIATEILGIHGWTNFPEVNSEVPGVSFFFFLHCVHLV